MTAHAPAAAGYIMIRAQVRALVRNPHMMTAVDCALQRFRPRERGEG